MASIWMLLVSIHLDIILCMELKDYLRTLGSDEARESFALRCGTTLNYLRLIAYNRSGRGKRASAELAICIDRESHGVVPVEKIRPDVDWDYLRSRA